MEKIVPIFVKPLKFSEDFDKKKTKTEQKQAKYCVLCLFLLYVVVADLCL